MASASRQSKSVFVCTCGILFAFSTSLIHADHTHWSLHPPTSYAPPPKQTLRHANRIRNEVDQFILRRLEQAKLDFAPEATRRTLIRRIYFDLLGLPPTPEQIAQFVEDPSPNAWANLIDSLLGSKHYGERWGRHWLDVVRYADSGGYETDIYYRNAWRYRDYVVKSFNDDKPYDVFLQEQIAGDELWPDNLDLDPRHVYEVSEEKQRHLEARTGTGLYAIGPRIHESGLDAKRLSYETLTDWVDTTASVFMGVTLACARCHDHKFDPFTQNDYFAMQAIFASAREVELPLWNAMGEADWRQSYPRVLAVQEARIAYQMFLEETKGKELSDEQQRRKQELFAAISNAVLKLPTSTAGQATIPYDGLMHVPSVSVLGRQHPELIKPVHLLERGELQQPRQVIPPALPASLVGVTKCSPVLPRPFGARKKLALWLSRKDHPLTARVIVNRIWQWHFGRGIVQTPNDFGLMGEPPTHPELLDWLAVRFMNDGWRVKALHRLILNSATYRQSSGFVSDQHLLIDPENKLLWRANRRRLEAEALWDAVHSVGGTINLQMGGRPVMPPLNEDELASLRDRWHWVTSADPNQHTRRGLYVLVRRNFKFPMFEVFDAPLTAVSCPTRNVTTVASQALWGLNSPSVFEQAKHFAGRVRKEADAEERERVQRAWQLALGRSPDDDELASALELIEKLGENSPQEQAWTKFCLTLFNLSEFAFVD